MTSTMTMMKIKNLQENGLLHETRSFFIKKHYSNVKKGGIRKCL